MAVRSGYGLGGTNKAFVWHKVSRRLRDWTRSLPGNLKLDPSASLHEVIEGEPSIMRRAVSRRCPRFSLCFSVSPSLCVCLSPLSLWLEAVCVGVRVCASRLYVGQPGVYITVFMCVCVLPRAKSKRE